MTLKFPALHPAAALLLVLASAVCPAGAQATVSVEGGAELREVKHSVTGLMLALENPAAVRSGVRVGMPSVRVRGNAGPVVSAATVQALAGRFGLAGADSALVFQRSDTDGLLMVHEQWGSFFRACRSMARG